jgi:glycosyltransferase involved in cell wall biosynthesis
MNFVHETRAEYVASISHAVLIPSYNTGARLCQTVAAIRRLGWPVWVIVDGSTDGSADELTRIASGDDALYIAVLPSNRGKGAAILHGLRLAHAHGFTHVVTVDADGQHCAEDIATLIAHSREYPEAMVLGVPIFDASAPTIRVAGHVIANFWANLVTLWSGIGDSLFGFRVYPIAPLLEAFAESPWMRRFEFDSEAAIRLCWQGVPPLNVGTPVRYFRSKDGGVSHFRYVRDNIRLVFMYIRLIAGLVRRLPMLLPRRFRSFRR